MSAEGTAGEREKLCRRRPAARGFWRASQTTTTTTRAEMAASRAENKTMPAAGDGGTGQRGGRRRSSLEDSGLHFLIFPLSLDHDDLASPAFLSSQKRPKSCQISSNLVNKSHSFYAM